MWVTSMPTAQWLAKNSRKKPGLHRTMLGDGLATVFAGLVGGPNTTYSENTAVLAATAIIILPLRVAALIAILISFFREGNRRDSVCA